MQVFNKKGLQAYRRDLRKHMTPAEVILWTIIRRKQLGYRFCRQYSVKNYILDFYCPECKLAIELDGSGHFDSDQIESDKERTRILNELGIRVLRFENFEVKQYPDRTTEEIIRYLKSDENPENLLLYGL